MPDAPTCAHCGERIPPKENMLWITRQGKPTICFHGDKPECLAAGNAGPTAQHKAHALGWGPADPPSTAGAFG